MRKLHISFKPEIKSSLRLILTKLHIQYSLKLNLVRSQCHTVYAIHLAPVYIVHIVNKDATLREYFVVDPAQEGKNNPTKTEWWVVKAVDWLMSYDA